jgi:predicted transcriptional regulator
MATSNSAAQHAIKVRSETKEQVKAAALALEKSQAEIVGLAIEEFLGRHADELRAGLDQARSALANGQSATVGYLLDVPAEDIRRLGGS